MCLRIVNETLKTANKDIECYKVLERKSGRLYSPYQDHKYYLGKSNPDVSLKITVKGKFFIEKTVHKGYHSFSYYKDAVKEIEDWGIENVGAYVVVRCIIPKGAMYYSGTFEVFHKEVRCRASSTIIIKEVITK